MELLLIFFIIAFAIFLLLRQNAPTVSQISIDHLPETFIVLDLETTGLDSRQHEIIEIAAIRYHKGSTNHQTIQALVKPSKKVPKKITDITGITQEMLEAEGESLAEAMQEFMTFIGNDRLVTFNAEFDMAFLNAARTHLGLPKLNNPVSCALKMARRAWPKRKSFRLSDLTSDGQFARGRAHRALEDARCTLIVYSAAVAKLRSVA